MSVTCKNIESFSYDKFKIKEKKIVYKKRDADGNFQGSIIMPTNYYPLHNDDIHVFFDGNTSLIENANILKLIDSVKYEIGRCYHNAERVCKVLTGNGYDAKMYCGWYFPTASNPSTILPVHHAWVVLNDKHVIDLANDYIFHIRYLENLTGKEYLEKLTTNEWRQEFVKVRKHIVNNNVKNSERCYLGSTCDGVYIGCEIYSATEGILLYQNMKTMYPVHETDKTENNIRANPLQTMLIDNGLM